MLLRSWAAERLEQEPEVLTVLFATGNVMSYIWTAFLPIAAFPASEAPHWRIYLGFACLGSVIFTEFILDCDKAIERVGLMIGAPKNLPVTQIYERTNSVKWSSLFYSNS